MMQTMTIDQSVLGAVLAIVMWLLAQFTLFMNSKTTEAKQKNKYSSLNTYIDLALKTVMDTVNAVNQTVVLDLKNKSADGKLTDVEKQEILADAVNSVMEALSDDVKSVLSKVFTDIPTWIELQMENYINQKKSEYPITTPIYAAPLISSGVITTSVNSDIPPSI